MLKKGQLLKQAITPGNPIPGKAQYIFDHYTKSGKLAVLNAGKSGKMQTFPPEFLVNVQNT